MITARPLAVVIAALLVTPGLACRASGGRSAAPAGAPVSETASRAPEEIFAIDPHIVTAVEYRSASGQVVAQRPGSSNDPFSIAVTSAAGAVERCRAGSGFDAVLSQLVSIHARPLTQAERQAIGAPAKRDQARLRILDATAIGPQEFGIILDSRYDGAVLFDGDRAYVSTVPKTTFQRLSGGCAVLGRPVRPVP